MERLRRFAQSVKDASWGTTVERVSRNPLYGGLRLVPQVGLAPIGPDPDSELEEFAHVASGSVPTRDPATKRLVYADDSAIVLVMVPGGKFGMGGRDPSQTDPDDGADEDEASVREMTLSAFFLAKHECTQAQWKVLAGGEAPSRFREGTEAPRRAAEQVSWEDCQKRLPELGLALPTEAQWEYACRAGSTTRFCFGDEGNALSAYAWYIDNTRSTVHPVGQLKPNEWGLHDMHGNVWEWCEDAYEAYASTRSGPMRDPVGVKGSGDRVNRGGSWNNTARLARSAFRFKDVPGHRFASLGLRPARAVTAN